MAVISVEEKHDRRKSSIRDGKKSHTRVWIVITDDIADGTAVALIADGIPEYGDEHPTDDKCLATSIDADPIQNSGFHFEVVVEYNTDSSTVSTPGSPLDRKPDINWGSTEATAPYFLDKSDPPKVVANTAGDPFEQYLERDEGEMVITITVNEATHDAAVADTFSHTVNAGQVLIDTTTFATGTLKLAPIQATKVSERVEENGSAEDFTYYKRTYTLKVRKDGWNDKPLDVGLNEKIGDLDTGFKLRPILDLTNQPVKKPCPLNGQGRKASTDPNTPAVTLEFKPYEQKSWASLKIANPAIWAA